MGFDNSKWSKTLSSSHQNVSKCEFKWFKCESPVKNSPHYVPFVGMCAGGICALQRMMCFVLRNSPDIQDVLFASGYCAVSSGMLTVRHWQAKLVRNDAPEQPFTSYRWDLLGRSFWVSQLLLRGDLRRAFLNFPKFPNEIELVGALLFTYYMSCSGFLPIFILYFHSPVTFPGTAFFRWSPCF